MSNSNSLAVTADWNDDHEPWIFRAMTPVQTRG